MDLKQDGGTSILSTGEIHDLILFRCTEIKLKHNLTTFREFFYLAHGRKEKFIMQINSFLIWIKYFSCL